MFLRFRRSCLFSPLAVGLVALLLLMPTGCIRPGDSGRLDPAVRDSMGSVGVVAAHFEPQIVLKGFARGKGHGAAMGAGRAVAGYFQALGQGNCSGEMCGAFYLLALMVTPVVAAGGAVVGTVVAEPAGKMRPAVAAANHALRELQLQQTLAEKVRTLALEVAGRDLSFLDQAGPLYQQDALDYGSLAGMGFDTVMETTVLEIGTMGPGIDVPVALFLKARLRLVRTADETVLYQRDYHFTSDSRKFLDWAADGGQSLCKELAAGIDDLARRMVHGILVVPKVNVPGQEVDGRQ